MNASQLRVEIVRPALHAISMWSQSAENLVMGTAAVESRLEYVKQVGGGPALSLFQIEPDTHDDIWNHYLAFRPAIVQTILESIGATTRPPADRLTWDLRYSTIMCRIHYRRKKSAFPNEHDVWGMAHYWKDHYNTSYGAGTPQKFVDAYRMVN